MNHVFNGQFYKGFIGKLSFYDQFPIIPFIKIQGKIIGNHNMTVLYPQFAHSVISGNEFYNVIPHPPIQDAAGSSVLRCTL